MAGKHILLPGISFRQKFPLLPNLLKVFH